MSTKNGLSSTFLGASIQGGVLSAVRLAAGLIRVKMVVMFFGAAGVGLISQANETSLLYISIGSMMLSGGLVTQLRKNADTARQLSYIRAAVAAQALISAILIAVSFIFAKRLSLALFDDADHAMWIYILALAVPLTVLSSGLLEGVLLAHNGYKHYVKTSSIATVASTSVAVVGVWLGGLHWVLIGWLLNGAFLFTGYCYGLRHKMNIPSALKPAWSTAEVKILFVHGASVLGAAVIQGLCMLTIRGQVIDVLGEHQLGWVQVIIALTAYYTPFLTNGLWGHFHPAVSGAAQPQVAHAELTRTLSWTCLIQTLFAVILHGYGKLLIPLAYSKEFLVAHDYFFEFLLGSGFYFFAFVFGVYFIAQGKAYYYLSGLAGYFLIWLGSVKINIQDLGLVAVPRGHLTGAAVIALICCLWLLKNVEWRLLKKLFLVFFLSLGLVVLQYILVDHAGLAVAGYLIPICYSALLFSKILQKFRKA